MIEAGNRAPQFELEGRTLPSPNSVLVFYKTTCPTCKLALPYMHRVNREVIGISQDNREVTSKFEREFEVQVSSLIDPAERGYAASGAYGIRYVPTMFVIDGEGKVAETIEGFDKDAMERLGVVFTDAERVPRYQHG